MGQGTVVVTGAGGFIGSHVVEQFARSGWAVVATDRPGVDLSGAERAGGRAAPADLLDEGRLIEVFRGADVVAHTAGIFDFSASDEVLERVNVTGVHTACRAALADGVKRFVMFSTVGVYGRPRRVPCGEDDPKHPRNMYERTKWRGEQAAWTYWKDAGLPVTALRPTLVYGPRGKYGLAIQLAALAIYRARGGRKLRNLRGGPLGHHVHVADVAEAAFLLATHPDAVGRSYNVADETPIRAEEMVRALARVLGMGDEPSLPYAAWVFRLLAWLAWHAYPRKRLDRANVWLQRQWAKIVEAQGLSPVLQPRFELTWLDYGGGDHAYDTRRLQSLGFRPKHPKFIDGLTETVDWYRRERWLPPVPSAA